jgi:nucleoside 2-deoxyribosyltransferase
VNKINIFIICPVRNATEEQKNAIKSFISLLEEHGNKVYYPDKDTNQTDLIGYRICEDNRKAIENADEVYIFWDKNSQGSLFDLGMAFAYKKPLYIINFNEVEETPTKSFANMITFWSMKGSK